MTLEKVMEQQEQIDEVARSHCKTILVAPQSLQVCSITARQPMVAGTMSHRHQYVEKAPLINVAASPKLSTVRKIDLHKPIWSDTSFHPVFGYSLYQRAVPKSIRGIVNLVFSKIR